MGKLYGRSLENPPVDEDEAIESIISFLQKKLRHDYPPGVSPVRRGLHAKAHGILQAEFIVDENVPWDLKAGLFKTPGRYPAWVRLSNGSPTVGPDTSRDVRAMAVKLMNVPGKKLGDEQFTQDLIMSNYPAFFLRNAVDLAQLISHPICFALNPLKLLRLREALRVAGALFQSVNNPLRIKYWSQTPYLLGGRAVKFAVQPHDADEKIDLLPTDTPNYLRAAMAHQLQVQARDALFDFMVQVQTSQSQMPVEDATAIWDESLSPFRKVATLRIPAQVFDSAERDKLGENLSFNPWHCLVEHRPLGSINRARRAIYQAISDLRHDMNGVQPHEPSPVGFA